MRVSVAILEGPHSSALCFAVCHQDRVNLDTLSWFSFRMILNVWMSLFWVWTNILVCEMIFTFWGKSSIP